MECATFLRVAAVRDDVWRIFAKHNSPAPKAAVRNISIPPIISADGSVLAPRSGPPQVRRACCHIFSARSEAAENAWPRHIAASASRWPSMSASARGVQEAVSSARGLAWPRSERQLAPHNRIIRHALTSVAGPPSLRAQELAARCQRSEHISSSSSAACRAFGRKRAPPLLSASAWSTVV